MGVIIKSKIYYPRVFIKSILEVFLMKDKTLKIRVSSKDLAEIKRRAELATCNVSAYVTTVSLGYTLVVVDETREFLHELRKIGGNLNQLAILAHQGRISCVNLEATKDALNHVYSGFFSINKKIRRQYHV